MIQEAPPEITAAEKKEEKKKMFYDNLVVRHTTRQDVEQLISSKVHTVCQLQHHGMMWK